MSVISTTSGSSIRNKNTWEIIRKTNYIRSDTPANTGLLLNIPRFANMMLVKLWGGGGGTQSSSAAPSPGGGGGYSEVLLYIEGNASYYISTGTGGAGANSSNTSTNIFKGGNAGVQAGGGGDASALFIFKNSGYYIAAIAGGGGGGGVGGVGGGVGGSGGGSVPTSGEGSSFGLFGAGGVGGNGTVAGGSVQLVEGSLNNVDFSSPLAGGNGGNGNLGAGGGGGFGGGGSSDSQSGGGGGGGGYVNLSSELGVVRALTISSVGSSPGNVTDTDRINSAGNGSTDLQAPNGLIVIYYYNYSSFSIVPTTYRKNDILWNISPNFGVLTFPLVDIYSTKLITVTNASNIYIDGPPVPGNNHTIDSTNGSYAINAYGTVNSQTPITINQSYIYLQNLNDATTQNIAETLQTRVGATAFYSTTGSYNTSYNNPSSGSIRILSSGVYIISVNLLMNNISSYIIRTVSVRINGNQVVEKTYMPSEFNSYSVSMFLTITHYLSSNDYVEIFVFQANASLTNADIRGSSYTRLFIQKII
jgi:hypothetical protein